jgi:hypothetical protein
MGFIMPQMKILEILQGNVRNELNQPDVLADRRLERELHVWMIGLQVAQQLGQVFAGMFSNA